MESVFAVSDVFFVSRLGPAAVATVGLTESMLTLIYAVAIGLSIGVTATVARRIGERDPERAAAAAVQGIALGLCFAVALGTLGATLAPSLLRLMGAAPDVVAVGSGFTRVMLGGNVVDRDALPHQRDLPRRRRRGHRDAGALARQPHQHRAGALPGLRRRPVPRSWA